LPATGVIDSNPFESPIVWLVKALLLSIGLPFFVLSSNGPLLQSWLSRSRLRLSRNPYSLYSASNLGSLVGLLSYPILIEPRMRLVTQNFAWGILFGGLLVLVFSCAVIARRFSDSGIQEELPGSEVSDKGATAADLPATDASPMRPFRWMALAFVPSSLMLGVTTYLTTDIASIPLLWIIPLATYLVSFVIVFSQRPLFRWQSLARVLPILAVTLIFLILSRATQPMALLIVVHILFFFVACMTCHGQLADERPTSERLTDFYLWLSLGSVAGSACTAILAPNIFKFVLEYPVAIVAACVLRPTASKVGHEKGRLWLDLAFPVLVGALALCLVAIEPVFDWGSVYLRNGVVIGIPLVFAFLFVDRRIRFGLGLTAVIAGSWSHLSSYGMTLHAERNFFGISRVTTSRDGSTHFLVHGSTLHGRQRMEPEGQCEPLTYYHRTGPAGDIFRWLQAKDGAKRVALIGLGAGSLGCYAVPGQEWTFYEIDPAVIRLAQNTNYFTYLGKCTRAEARIIPGDARLRIREAPPAMFDLILVDAFSSDAIPVHLMTVEALNLYLSKLATGGLLAFHISNRYLELEPVLGSLAKELKLVARTRDDWSLDPSEAAAGKEQSQWVVLVRVEKDLLLLSRSSRWLPIDHDKAAAVWTDDFSNVLSVFKWK
jgi:hypothetical protein